MSRQSAHEKRKVRAAVAERDGNWCLLCGKPGPGLHLHRVIYGSQGGRYENSNCVLLCFHDHARVHDAKKTWQPRLLAYLADPTPDAARRVVRDILRGSPAA